MNYFYNFQEEIAYKSLSFRDHGLKVLEKIKQSMLQYMRVTNTKNALEMTLLFSLSDIDTGSVCAGKMESVGGWRCLDCIKYENTVFCQNCWSQMKNQHKDHRIVFLTSVSGTCDCGDPNTIDKQYFCPKHKGPMTSDIEIEGYKKSCLGDKIVSDLKNINKIMFKDMANYVIRAIQDKKTNEKMFPEVIAGFIDFISTPCATSRACMHIIAEFLLENYPFKTKHVCLQLKGEKGKIIKSSLLSHDCTCPFIKILMPFWPLGKEKIIYSFLYNYQLRKTMGLCYFLLYGDFIKNCLPDFTDLSVQIIFDDVCKVASSIEGLIDNIYECMPEIFNIFLSPKNFFDNPNQIPLITAIDLLRLQLKESKKYVIFKEIIYKLKADTIYVMKSLSLHYLSNNTNIIFQLIDLMCFLQNINSVKSIFPHPKFQAEKYNIDLLDIELWLLDIFSFYISIFNFESSHLVKEIFQYFSKKINNKKYIIQHDEYSFHIPIYRAFSIFLNRYCFFYANTKNTDVFHGLQSAIKKIPNHKECFKIMIESIYKVFGYITACGEEFFNYYGENMIEYEYLYYYNKQFIYRDFCLMKYLLSIKENENYFGFEKILRLCQVENSNKPLEDNILKGNKMIEPDKWLNENNKKYLKFSAKILRIILSILRNNTCLIWNLGASYSMLKSNKFEDKLLKDVINKDKNNFIELTKELIINQTFIKENLAFYTDIYDNVFLCIKEILGEKTVKELILSMTNRTLTQEKKAKFSIKDEYLYYLDLNYIIYPRHKSTVEKYISDFKQKIVTIFNTHFYPVNKFEAKLTLENYKYLYYNEDNFDFLFIFTSFILERKGYLILNEFFIGVLLNYLATFFCLENDQFIFFRETISNKIYQLIQILEKNNLTDDVQKSYCRFIVEKIGEHDKIYSNSLNSAPGSNNNNNNNNNTINNNTINNNNSINNNNDNNIINNNNINNNNIDNEKINIINEPKKELNVQPVKKNAKISMKDKMKNKFKKKNDNISNKFGIEKIKIEKKKNNEACIYCLKPIETDDIKKPYGKIGDFLYDNYLSNAFFQVIRKEYKKHYDADLKLGEFDALYYQPAERKNIRIISCNHYIHFSCHFEAFMKSDLKNSLNIFQCPLCHKFSETFIPMLDQYTDEETFNLFKGFNLNYIYTFGENNAKILLKREVLLKQSSKKYLDELDAKEKKEEEEGKDEIKEEKEKEKEKEDNIELPPYDLSQITEVNNNNPSIDINIFKKNYPEFINACRHLIEGFIGMKLYVNHVDMDNDLFKSLMTNFLVIFSIQYRDLMDFFENVDDRKTSINLWKNLLLSLRLLIKLNIMDEGFFYCKFYNILEELKSLSFDRDLIDFIQNDSLRLKLCQLFFLLALLLDYEEIEGYEKYIIYIALPIFGFGFFFKDIYFQNSFIFKKANFLSSLTEEKLYEYFKKDKSLENITLHVLKQLLITKLLIKNDIDCDFDKISLEINDILDLLQLPELKNKSFLEILEHLEKVIMAEISTDKNQNLAKVFKPKNNHREMLKILLDDHINVATKDKCDKILSPSLFGSCLAIKYSFINLPELAIDFEYEVYNKTCEVCKVKGKNSLICLDCGKKVCDSRSCLTKINGVSLPGFIAHTKTCGGGRSAFLQTYDCSVLFVSNRVVFKKFVPFYVNQFGEGITKSSFGSEFKLSKDEVENALKMFTKYTYSNAPIIS